MSQITIIFSHSKKYNPYFFWIRKTFLRHSSTHVAFGIEKGGLPHVFHMSGKGAIRTPRDKFLIKNNIIKEYKIVPDLSEQLKSHLKYLGVKYDLNSAIWHFIALLIRPLKQLLIFYKVKNSFYCANFARQIDKDNKIKSWQKINHYWASVDELQNACENSSEFIDINK